MARDPLPLLDEPDVEVGAAPAPQARQAEAPHHRRDQGEPITIEGWRADLAEPGAPAKVEFNYIDGEGRHSAAWEASLQEGRVTPRNEIARDISWH